MNVLAVLSKELFLLSCSLRSWLMLGRDRAAAAAADNDDDPIKKEYYSDTLLAP